MTINSWFNTSFTPRDDNTGLTDFKVNIQTHPFERDLDFVRCGGRVAEHILNSYTEDIYVGLSGGQHSEYVLRRLVDADADRVTPLIISLPWNSEEVAYARSLCTKLGVEPWVMEYNDRQWLYNKFNSLTYSQGRVGFIQSAVLLASELVEGQGGKLVTGGGHHFNIGYEPNLGVTSFLEDLYFYEWDYYVVDRGHPGPFFTQSLQLFDSMIMNTDYTLDVYSSLCYLYRHPYREYRTVDLGLFKEARNNWSWGEQRPRWKVKFNRTSLKNLFNSRVI